MYFTNGILQNPVTMTILILLILSNFKEYFTSPTKLIILLLSIPGLLVAITFHEYAHALVAEKLGDDTPRRQGRLTLNPLKHLDLYGTILLLVSGFGWGKPVEINPNNFKRTISIKKGNALVSLAGPIMNFILALVFSIIFGLYIRYGTVIALTNQVGFELAQIIK